MTKRDAIRELVAQGYRKRSSYSSAVRAYKALETLGLETIDALDMLRGMEYYDDRMLAQIAKLLPLLIDEAHNRALLSMREVV